MNYVSEINRRSFLVGGAAAGSGLALGFHLPLSSDAAEAASGPEVNAWVVVQPDETVIIRIARSEMGQGTLTGLAQLAAEELECDWSKVTYEFPTPGRNVARKRVWGDFFTAGSRGIRESNDFVRKGGAAARMMLIEAASNEWKVPVQECSAANGVITHKGSNRSTTYGKVAQAASKVEPPKEITLKDPKDWKIIGKGVKRLDTGDKVVGKAIYGIDIRLPGMLYAAIKACPVNGGKVKSFDAAKITGNKGIKKVVRVEDYAVAVIADSWWRAKTALDSLPIEWDEGENAKVSSASIAAWLKEGLDVEQAFVGNKGGDVKAALASATKKYEAVYGYPYQNHATMEPQNATALYTPDKCEVWCSNSERRSRARGHFRSIRAADPQVRSVQDFPWRRIWPALNLARLRSPGGPLGQGDAGHPGQAAVVARRGHDARLVSPYHAMQAHRWVRRRQELDGPARAHFRPVDPCQGEAGRIAGWARSGDILRFLCRRSRSGARLFGPQYPGGPFHAESAHQSRLLAGRKHQP